jgi:hypothetical protein
MRTKALILLTLCWAGLASTARADITYQYVTDTTAYAVNPGATVNVNVYLQETVTGTSSSLIAAETGLFSAGFYLTQSGQVPTNPTIITAMTPNTQGQPAGFSGGVANAPKFTGSQGALTEGLPVTYTGPGPSGSTQGGSVANGITRVFLGTVTLTAGDPGTTTTFSVESYKFAPTSIGGNGANGNTLTNGTGFDLDQTNNGTANGPPVYVGANNFNGTTAYTFLVASAPEPGSMILAFLAASGMGLGGAWRHWRNRRQVQA